jgi:hypothetical protein
MLSQVKAFDFSVCGYCLRVFLFKNCPFYVIGVVRKSS